MRSKPADRMLEIAGMAAVGRAPAADLDCLTVTHEVTPEHIPTIRADEYVAPFFEKKAFHCPLCGVYAGQKWERLNGTFSDTRAHRGECLNCRDESSWIRDAAIEFVGRMVEPDGSPSAPRPPVDMPDDCRADYEEARAIVERSPRAACGLLRVVVENLCADLGESGKNLNSYIGSLVKKGLDPQVQQALDSLRVIGNDAVHPGQLNLNDDPITAASLFGWINFIVEQMITRPKQLEALYGNLPENKRAAIEQRDAAG